ncbi:MAG TPA: hypothetical protein VKX49_31565 [Bryobacteraceae bacterium]|nr:hypothetical protein [Bryobacteraceae bacterium]
MPDLVRASNARANHVPSWFVSSFAMVIILAATVASIVGLLRVVTWMECLLLLIAGIALSGGVLFTISTMQRLGKDE